MIFSRRAMLNAEQQASINEFEGGFGSLEPNASY